MVFLHLSDEAVEIAKKEAVPLVGEHVGEWVTVLREVDHWQQILHPNRILVEVPFPTLKHLHRIIDHLRKNTRVTPGVELIINAVAAEVAVDNIVVVEVPSEDDEDTVIRVIQAIAMPGEGDEEE